jgi:hypothetical protein
MFVSAHYPIAKPFGFHAPSWAEYVAADCDGTVWAFQSRPILHEGAPSWCNTAGRHGLMGSLRCEVPNWQALLLHRHGTAWVPVMEEDALEARRRARVSMLATLRVVAQLALVIALVMLVKFAITG